jgi:hypothetical protein
MEMARELRSSGSCAFHPAEVAEQAEKDARSREQRLRDLIAYLEGGSASTNGGA